MILYTYISHNKKIVTDYESIKSVMAKIGYDHYKIFYSGQDLSIEDDHVIHIDCNDTYEGLSNKVHNICKYVYDNKSLTQNYSHIYKIDATTIPNSIIPVIDKDYYGYAMYEKSVPNYRRYYHVGKCSPESFWNRKKYSGEFVPYCAGGFGYALSLKALECIAHNPDDHENDIYEDLYVAQKLLKYDIFPHYMNPLTYLSKY